MPGLRLIGDISCFPAGEGWLYLATVLDLCSKELIGYAIAPHMRADLAVEAINAAHHAELVAGNAIMHTDPGVWRSGKAPAGPAPASTAPRPSRSLSPS